METQTAPGLKKVLLPGGFQISRLYAGPKTRPALNSQRLASEKPAVFLGAYSEGPCPKENEANQSFPWLLAQLTIIFTQSSPSPKLKKKLKTC